MSRPDPRSSLPVVLGLGAALLIGCGASRRPGGGGAPPRPEAPPPDAIGAYFVASSSAEPWTLIDENGKALCQLPCSRWVAPRSGWKIQRDADRASERRTLDLPVLDYRPGEVIDISVARPPHIAGYVLMYSGASLALLGVGFAAIGSISDPLGTLDGVSTVGWSMVGIGGVAATTGVLFVFTVPSSRAYLDVTRSELVGVDVEIGPGVVHVETTDVVVNVTPFGAIGTF